MPTYQEMSRFGKAAMEYLEQKGLPKTSENFSNAVDLAKQGMLPKAVTTAAPVNSWDDLLEPNKKPVNSWDDLLEPNKKPVNSWDDLFDIQWATNPVSNTQKVTTPATASTVASAKQVLNPLDKETNYVLSNPKFGGALGKNINNATDEEIAAARQIAQANLDARSPQTNMTNAPAPAPAPASLSAPGTLTQWDKETNYVLSSPKFGGTLGKNLTNSTSEEISAARQTAKDNLEARGVKVPVQIDPSLVANARAIAGSDARASSESVQDIINAQRAKAFNTDWDAIINAKVNPQPPKPQEFDRFSSIADKSQIPILALTGGVGTAAISSQITPPTWDAAKNTNAVDPWGVDTGAMAGYNSSRTGEPGYSGQSGNILNQALIQSNEPEGIIKPSSTVKNAKQVMSRNNQPLIDLNTKNSGEQASVPSARALWDIYNQTGSAADFVRASNAQKLEDPGNAKFEAAANEKRGGSVSGKGKDGGMNPKEAVLHKALEIIHHMISRGR